MVKNAKRVIAIAMAAALSIGMVQAESTDASAAAKITLSKTKLTLQKGGKAKITLKNVKKASVKSIKWTTSNKKVATVSPAQKSATTTVKAVGAGKATVKAKLAGKTYSCKVTVNNKYTSKDVKLYVNEAMIFPTKVYYAAGSDIPYVSVEGIAKDFLLPGFADDPKLKIEVKTEGDRVSYVRPDGFSAVFDFAEHEIYFSDLDEFCSTSTGDFYSTINFAGKTKLFNKSESAYVRHGAPVEINLDDYGIPMGTDGKEHFIPLQTFSDVFVSTLIASGAFLFNGQNIFMYAGDASLTEGIKKLYYEGEDGAKVEKKKLSKEFIDFNFNELCLGLDLNYGLKEPHDITEFSKFFSDTYLTSLLMNYEEGATGVDAAVYSMINYYLDDLHSSYQSYSYNSEFNGDAEAYAQLKSLPKGACFKRYVEIYTQLGEMYKKKYPDGLKCYEVVGDTAYVKFNSFHSVPGTDYSTKPTADDVKADANGGDTTVDTIRLMQYAYDQISSDPKVKRVVLDLSNNTGGEITTALYVIGTFLGEGVITTKNTATGSMSNSVYQIDTNCDGKFDDKDTLQSTELKARGLKMYCLISNTSFSCGNLVPCMFKDSKKVTLIGQTSGGGSCAVGGLSTATGTVFNISSKYRFSFTKNGSFYDVDRGADPDVYIKDMSKLYDRTYLNTILDKIE